MEKNYVSDLVLLFAFLCFLLIGVLGQIELSNERSLLREKALEHLGDSPETLELIRLAPKGAEAGGRNSEFAEAIGNSDFQNVFPNVWIVKSHRENSVVTLVYEDIELVGEFKE